MQIIETTAGPAWAWYVPMYGTPPHERTGPCRCPVCDGRGTMPCGFYTGLPCSLRGDTGPDQCRTCGGTGVLWR